MRAALTQGTNVSWNFVLLAPPEAASGQSFGRYSYDDDTYWRLLAEMQRLRGRVYVQDGALEPWQLTADGRHDASSDHDSWHILVMQRGTVHGCMRYILHGSHPAYSQLAVSHSALAKCGRCGPVLRNSVESELSHARQLGMNFGEAGGWALSEELRRSTAAVRMVLATYSLAQLLGDAIVLSTATMRNGSATILQRIGGHPLPVGEDGADTYFDRQYKCEMQLLRFDSRSPSAKYFEGVTSHRSHLTDSLLICGSVTRRAASAAA